MDPNIVNAVVAVGIYVLISEAVVESVGMLSEGSWKPWAALVSGTILSLMFGKGILSFVELDPVVNEWIFSTLNALFTGIIVVRGGGKLNILVDKIRKPTQ